VGKGEMAIRVWLSLMSSQVERFEGDRVFGDREREREPQFFFRLDILILSRDPYFISFGYFQFVYFRFSGF
jgi:hypothetical protein